MKPSSSAFSPSCLVVASSSMELDSPLLSKMSLSDDLSPFITLSIDSVPSGGSSSSSSWSWIGLVKVMVALKDMVLGF